jgi:hypothetical protein
MSDDRELQARIESCCARAAAWLWSMQVPGQPAGVLRFSTRHDPARWPGVLLPATYNGVMALDLLGELGRLSLGERQALADFHRGFRGEDGAFAIPEMRDGDVFKKPDRDETWGYIRFHLSNYALGALQALQAHDDLRLGFVGPFLEEQHLEAWLSRRDLRDPWQEGNNIVNLGSFLLLLRERGDTTARWRAERALRILFDWHDRLQEPSTGFWGVGQAHDGRLALHAMAGATHNFHLWYACRRPVPHVERAIDYCLTLPTRIDSACIDVDAVDILAHGHLLVDHRRGDLRSWLEEKLAGLLDLQGEDGGFCDEREGVRRVDGWVKGYEEPQGVSNTFATWFRLIAIAMIAETLWPGWRTWQFRRMIGIGYFAGRQEGAGG